MPKGSKAALWKLAFNTGEGGETCVVFYVFAVMQLTRFRPARRRAGGVRFARLRRKAKHRLFSAISLPKALLPPDSIVLLRLRRKRWHLKNNQPNLWSKVGWLRKRFYLSGQCSTQRQGDKRSAAADVIASNAPLREGSHKARQNGPKHYPRGFKGIAIPLARLSPLSFAVQRKMEPSETVGQVER